MKLSHEWTVNRVKNQQIGQKTSKYLKDMTNECFVSISANIIALPIIVTDRQSNFYERFYL